MKVVRPWEPGFMSSTRFRVSLNSEAEDERADVNTQRHINKVRLTESLVNEVEAIGLFKPSFNLSKRILCAHVYEMTEMLYGTYNGTRTRDALFELIFRYIAMGIFTDDVFEEEPTTVPVMLEKCIREISEWRTIKLSPETTVYSRFFIESIFRPLDKLVPSQFVDRFAADHVTHISGIRATFLLSRDAPLDEFIQKRRDDAGYQMLWAMVMLISNRGDLPDLPIPQNILTDINTLHFIQNDAFSYDREFDYEAVHNIFRKVATVHGLTAIESFEYVSEKLWQPALERVLAYFADRISNSGQEDVVLYKAFLRAMDGLYHWYMSSERYRSTTNLFKEMLGQSTMKQ